MKKLLLFLIILPGLLNAQVSDALKLRVTYNGYQDETVFRFLDGATSGYDGNYDAFKFFSPNPAVPSIFTRIANNWEMAINSLPGIDKSWSVPVYIKAPASGSYTIEAEFPGPFPGAAGLMLRNNLDGTWHEITDTFSISINLPADTVAILPVITVEVHYHPAITIEDVQCAGGTDGKVVYSVSNDSLLNCELTRLSDNHKIQLPPQLSADTISGLQAGGYKLSLTYFSGMMLDSMINVNEPDPILLDLFASTQFIQQDTATVLFSSSSSSSAPVNWFIQSDTLVGNPVSWFFSSQGEYMVYASQTDASGCMASDSVLVELAGVPLSVKEISGNGPLIFYSKGKLSLRNLPEGNIRVSGMDGRLIYEGRSSGNLELATEAWGKGVYLVSGSRIPVRKVFVN